MKNFLKGTQFITSAFDLGGFGPDIGREVCFIGRSNAGKSSAINALCEQRKLVKTSRTPGHTQSINFFAVDDNRRLVDLPGYGYAKGGAKKTQYWNQLLEGYFSGRTSLRCVFLIVDIRRGLMDKDIVAMQWLYGLREYCAIHILLTKSDKLSTSGAQKVLQQTEAFIKSYQNDNPQDHDKNSISAQVFSANKGTGVVTARAQLHSYLSTH